MWWGKGSLLLHPGPRIGLRNVLNWKESPPLTPQYRALPDRRNVIQSSRREGGRSYRLRFTGNDAKAQEGPCSVPLLPALHSFPRLFILPSFCLSLPTSVIKTCYCSSNHIWLLLELIVLNLVSVPREELGSSQGSPGQDETSSGFRAAWGRPCALGPPPTNNE